MERDNNRRKRARDEKDQKRRDKKPGDMISDGDDEDFVVYEFREDEYGVFEYPWQKEGMLSKFDELVEPRDSLFGILEATNKVAEEGKLPCMQEQDSLLRRQDLLDCKYDANELPSLAVVDDLHEQLDTLFDDPPK